jgi:hypothetical protein
MNSKKIILSNDVIKNKIYTIRDKQVILDRDLAELYGVKTKVLNQAVKRNIERFPNEFCFRLTEKEFKEVLNQYKYNNINSNLKSQIVTSRWGGIRKLPQVFTEQGVSMLSALLKSDAAVDMSIKIIKAFVSMRHFLMKNAEVFMRLDKVERKQIEHDDNFNKIFNAIESKQLTPKQDIFFEGQIFVAHKFIVDLIKQASKSIILIDNYIDENVLTLLSNKNKDVSIKIYTANLSDKLILAKDKFNKQYDNLEIKEFKKSHDRFLIIDKQAYHIGASLKDVGKKWFCFSKIEKDSIKILDNLN